MVDFQLDEEVRAVLERYRSFVEEAVLPREGDADFETSDAVPADVLEDVRAEARKRDLWLPHMPEAWGGLGLDAIALAHVHEELARSPIGPLAVNAMAPDEGNMHALLHFGTEEQQGRYLAPLAEAEARSCFAMTEPEAGADPYQISTRAEKDGDEWVIDGDKWFVTGAEGADFAVVVAVTDPDVHPKEGTTLFLADTDQPGFQVDRDVPCMGAWSLGGHCELTLDDLRVHEDDVLGPLGRGYMVAQDRLALGRTTHAMRWIGMAQRALDRMTERALDRESFGKRLSEHQAIQWMIADSVQDLYMARNMVLRTARQIEDGDDPSHEVSVLKVHAANAAQEIIDRAIQVHGALGYSKDLMLERFFRDARAGRIYDGPDEVHKWSIAKNALEAVEEEGTTRAVTGGWTA
jgi:acyl-CoA dehydrogenase